MSANRTHWSIRSKHKLLKLQQRRILPLPKACLVWRTAHQADKGLKIRNLSRGWIKTLLKNLITIKKVVNLWSFQYLYKRQTSTCLMMRSRVPLESMWNQLTKTKMKMIKNQTAVATKTRFSLQKISKRITLIILCLIVVILTDYVNLTSLKLLFQVLEPIYTVISTILPSNKFVLQEYHR